MVSELAEPILGKLLHAGYLAIQKCYEYGLAGRTSVDPVFGLAAIVRGLADFLIGSAHRGNYHVGIHSLHPVDVEHRWCLIMAIPCRI